MTSANGTKSADTPTETNGDHLANDVKGLSVSDQTPENAEPPAQKTAAGAPESDVVFDHPPSKSEIKEAHEVMDHAEPSAEEKK